MEDSQTKTPASSCDSPDCGCHPRIPRRDFIRLTGLAATAAVFPRLAFAKGQTVNEFVRLVPAEKSLDPKWVESLFARGARSVYRGGELKYIGMPVGGICAGQVFLGGDGRLWLWDVFNQIKFGVVPKTIEYRGRQLSAGDGANYVEPPEQVHPFEQGFALEVDGHVRPLDHRGWTEIGCSPEYPMGFVEYRDPASPVHVSLEAFSPFVPLNSEDSGLPGAVMRFTVKNAGAAPAKVALAGWLENAAGRYSTAAGEAIRRMRLVRADGQSRLEATLHELPPDPNLRPKIVFDDFEKPTYEGWITVGDAFGPGPIERSKMPAYQGDVGGEGKRVVNTHNARNGEDVVQADAHTGRLIGREFKIERHFIDFFIGGGNHPGKTCMNLVIDGQVVRTATGHDDNRMRREFFDVREFEGRTAHLEIVDDWTGPWGNIGIDQIEFADRPATSVALADRPDYGDMSLALLGAEGGEWHAFDLSGDDVAAAAFRRGGRGGAPEADEKPVGERQIGALGRETTLAAGQEAVFTFVVTWRFPNLELSLLGKVGNHYATRFPSSGAVAGYVGKSFDRLYRQTKLWHETWYDSTLPYWLLDRAMATTATLATMTCVRFANGRFYGWEGIGCCDGTCGHVWQYAQAMARLFPDLERSVRERVDFGVAFHEDTGIIEFRGEYGNGYATDSQAGYVLRAYREHQMSADDKFLRRVYPRAKKALQYLIRQDGNGDGIIENAQHNTLDVDLYGPSSWLSSLYLAALRAGEEMAKEVGDPAFAGQCRAIFEKGTRNILSLWNGEYFVQKYDPRYPDALRYGDGCEVDQVMGQGWSWQVGLGRILDPDHTRQALRALYRNNYLPDVGPYRDKFTAGRWYAVPGEGGLLICTFPQGDRDEILGNKPTWASMYFNECMTGFEYEAAGHMVAEGLLQEGLAVARTVHDRYHPARRNPFNEVECSDHYARCMAMYGVFVAACGFEYHGPKGRIAFAPRLTPENFRAPFTAAEGWGTYAQKIEGRTTTAQIHVRHGRLRLQTIGLVAPAPTNLRVRLGNEAVEATHTHAEGRLEIALAQEVTISEGQRLVVEFDGTD